MGANESRIAGLLGQLTRFGGVGIIIAVFSISIYYVTLDILEWPLYPTYGGVYLIAVFFSYRLNAKYTFNVKHNFVDLLRYYLIYIIGLAFGLSLLFLGKRYLEISNFWLTILTIIPRTAFIFVISKILIFKDQKEVT